MEAGLAAARFIHFASLMVLFGALFYVNTLAPADHRQELRAATPKAAGPLALLALVSAIGWALAVAAELTDGALDVDGLAAVMTDTSFGRIWCARLALLVGLVMLTFRGGGRLATTAAGAALASLALVGHAAMQTGSLGLAHRLNHALHLLLTGGWLGALPLFLLSLRVFVRDPRRRDSLAAMMRFSRVGHFAVALVFLTGATDVALTTGALPWPPDSAYRAGLCAKIGIVTLMTALALINRYFLAPRIARPAAARALAVGALTEMALALSAVALVSLFATLNPE